MNETTGKIEVRVGDGDIGVFIQDEEARDVLCPFNAPQYRNVGVPPLPSL